MHIKLTEGSTGDHRMRLYLEVSLDIMVFHSFILKPSLFVPLDIPNLVTCHLLEEMGPIPVTDTARHGVGEHRCDVLCCAVVWEEGAVTTNRMHRLLMFTSSLTFQELPVFMYL